jgi:predicted MFS family arabinose efflux permease
LFTAPIAILVDCTSYLVSAGSLFTIGAREQPLHSAQRGGLRNQVGEGIRAVAGHTLLRPLFIGTTLGNAADGLAFQSGVMVLLLTRELHFDAATIGAVFAGLGIGGLIGAALAGPLLQTVGLGATILGCLTLWSVGYGGLAFITQSTTASVVAAVLLGALGAINPIAGANISTVRQIVTPYSLLGRVTAVGTVGSAAAIAVGSFFGGVLGDTVGLRTTLMISGLLPLLGVALLLLSPVRRLRRVEMLAAEGISLTTESLRQ